MGKKIAEPHINHERWMVSFADFMTLMFALFVVLFAISTVDPVKYVEVTESISEAFGAVPGSGAAIMSPEAGQKDTVNVIPVIQSNPQLVVVEKEVKEAVESDEELRESVAVRRDARGVIISLKDTRFFDSGSATLRPDIRAKLKKILEKAKINSTMKFDLRVEGHTDNIPMRGGAYSSNWELSAARAATVLRFIRSNTNYDQKKLSLAGYGEFRPIDTNDTAEGRANNRRVDIVILGQEEGAKNPEGKESLANGTSDDLTTSDGVSSLNQQLEQKIRLEKSETSLKQELKSKRGGN